MPRKTKCPKKLAAPREGDELFFGVVGPLGTNRDRVTRGLAQALEMCDYDAEVIPYRSLIEEAQSWKRVPRRHQEIVASVRDLSKQGKLYRDARTRLYQDLGNEIRKLFNSGDALTQLAIGGVRELRGGRKPRQRVAYVFDSLKHPEEVKTLRHVYGNRFFLVGAYMSLEQRLKVLSKEFADSHASSRPNEFLPVALELAQRDEYEKGEKMGQNVSDTFAQSDFFVDAAEEEAAFDAQMQRFVDAVFGYQFHTPTRDEHAMMIAHVAGLRSAAMARQVGAAITTTDGAVVSVGCNDVPKAHGGLYWSEDGENDHRDFREGADASDEMRRVLITEIFTVLLENGWINKEVGQRPKDLLEEATSLASALRTRIESLAKGIVAGDKKARDDAKLLVAARKVDESKKRDARATIDDCFSGKLRSPHYLTNILLELYKPILKEAQVMRLNEFGRTVHAEMTAITQAACGQGGLRGATLYTTTFPCHECSRHILSTGIARVVYVEPYPKSYAREQHGDAIKLDAVKPTDTMSAFGAFVGIAPRRYSEIFSMSTKELDRKDEAGKKVDWDRRKSRPYVPEPPVGYIERETIENKDFRKQVEQMGII